MKLREMRLVLGQEDFRSVVVSPKRTHGSGWTQVLPRYALRLCTILWLDRTRLRNLRADYRDVLLVP